MTDEEIKSEKESLEFEDWENSGTEDDFDTWKIKRYVDDRIAEEIESIEPL